MRPDGMTHSQSHSQSQSMRKALGLVATSITDPKHVQLPPYYPDLPDVRADIARHYDNIHAMDQRVGEILAALQDDGLAESTLIIWTSDHGDGLPEPNANFLIQESMCRCCCIVQAKQAPQEDSQLISFVDLAPTHTLWQVALRHQATGMGGIFQPNSQIVTTSTPAAIALTRSTIGSEPCVPRASSTSAAIVQRSQEGMHWPIATT